MHETFLSGGGTVTVSDSLASLSSTSTPNSFSVIRTLRKAHQAPGEGIIAVFSAEFDTGVADSTQQAGLGTITNSLVVGYNGADFSVLRSFGGKTEIRTLTVTGAATGGENATITLNGVAETVPLTNGGGDTAFTAYEIAQRDYTLSNFIAQQEGSTVVFSYRGDGAQSGTYSFSSASATATIAQTVAGVTKTNDWVAQADFNIDTLDGTGDSGYTLIPTNGNIYSIEFQWMGYGVVTFSVQRNTGAFIPFHRISLLNSGTVPILAIPSMPFQWNVASLGTTTPLTMKAGGCGMFAEGGFVTTAPTFGTNVVKTISSNTETNMLVLKVSRIFKGLFNQREATIRRLSMSNETNRTLFVKIYQDPTSIGDGTTTDYSDFAFSNPNSCVLLDTNSTSITGGVNIFSFSIPQDGGEILNFVNENVNFEADTILAITVESRNADDVGLSITWEELG